MDELTAAVALRDVRKHNEPAPDAEGAKRTTCCDCGADFWQWVRSYKDTCADCAARRGAESIESMRSKSGPMYERWLTRQYVRLRAEMIRLGLHPDAD